jgi:signal transduction histidine kinase
MPRRFPVRVKLTAALAVPMVVLMTLAVSKVLETRQDARRARDQAELALSTTGPRSLLRTLQSERNLTGAWLLDATDLVDLPYDRLDEVRPAVDGALGDFRTELAGAGGRVRAAYEPAVDAMVRLPALRMRVDGFTGRRGLDNLDLTQQVFDAYSDLVDQLFAAGARVSVAVDDPDLRRGAELVNVVNRQSDTIALLVRELLLAAVGGDADGVNTRSELRSVESLLTRLREGEDALRSHAEGPYRHDVERLFASQPIQQFPRLVDRALDVGTVDIAAVLAAAAPEGVFGYDALLDATAAELQRKASALISDASRTQDLYTLFGGVVALVVVGVAWLVSRSITRPLRSLTRQAAAMAGERLPGAVQEVLETPLGEDVAVPSVRPIEITTRDEVGDVASALNTVQSSALRLAVEQAVLRRNIADALVSLGRRNQSLLGRQLDFITDLERNETDPEALASLFRLDHLATRMRRNAESLVVLAGVDPPRQWTAPVRLSDVIRAALSEVEDYHRVVVRGLEPVTVVGAAAAGLAHLLAELIENALTFSPPDGNVEVRGRSSDMGGAGAGYVLAVVDFGYGMSADELERANRRLAGAESFTVAPSTYLGHYVTGNLASRHGISVELRSTAGLPSGGGVTATITLPPELLTTEPVAASAAADAAAGGSEPGPAARAELIRNLPPPRSRWRRRPTGPVVTVEPTSPPAQDPAPPRPDVVIEPRPAPAQDPTPSGPVIIVEPSVPVAAEETVAAEAGPEVEASEADDGGEDGGTGRQVGATPDADLLRTLANYRVEGASYRVNSTSFRIDRGRASESGLSQRVPGAHLPNTTPVRLRRRQETGADSAPGDVYVLLSRPDAVSREGDD